MRAAAAGYHKTRMARYLVTGCAGFIGSSLTEKLVETFVPQGHVIRGLDNFETGRRENLATFCDRIEFIECDLAMPQQLQRPARELISFSMWRPGPRFRVW